ncbi:MAG: host-nuclease inhibitor Gam family protein [Peptococcaceae bacterium]|nr:host-nuclease inhibitor Gam family protein [Peptococcaceae bacterium]
MMARKRLPDQPVIRSWEEADQVLKEIASLEIELADIEGALNLKINAEKERADTEARPLRDRLELLGSQLKDFAETSRAEFGKAKSRQLTFGSLGWRASKAITIKKALTERIIGNLKRLGMDDCIKTTETISKEILSTYPDEKIIQAGATLKKADTFWYEVDRTSLAGNQPAE